MKLLKMIIRNFSDKELEKVAQKDVLIKNVLFSFFEGAVLFREELNKWIEFFEKKGFWSESLKNKILGSFDWYDFYSKINELKLGYFLEKELGIKVISYEPITVNKKNVDFKGVADNQDYYIELKTKVEKNKRKSGSYNGSDKICFAFSDARKQFFLNTKNILFLSDDLEVSLFVDMSAQNTIYELLKQKPEERNHFKDFKNISAVCLFGGIYMENMYKLSWTINKRAENKINPNIFSSYEKIFKF